MEPSKLEYLSSMGEDKVRQWKPSKVAPTASHARTCAEERRNMKLYPGQKDSGRVETKTRRNGRVIRSDAPTDILPAKIGKWSYFAPAKKGEPVLSGTFSADFASTEREARRYVYDLLGYKPSGLSVTFSGFVKVRG